MEKTVKRRVPVAALAALVGVLAFVAAGCGGGGGSGGGGGTSSAGGGATKNPSFHLTIGDLVPLTGDLSVFGPSGRFAANLAVTEAQKALKQAGATNIKVSIEHADTQTQPQAAVSAARKLVSDGATCLAGAWASADTIPVAQSVSSRQQIPQISPASTSAQITTLKDNGYLFRTAPSDVLQGKALADVIAQTMGKKTVLSLAARNDAYGQGFIDRVKQVWTGMGGKVTSASPVLYDPNAASYDSEAQSIVSGNPGAYVIIDFPQTYSKVGAALLRTGKFDASKMWTADGLASSTIPQGVPAAALNGARGTRPGTPASGPAVTAFNKLYQQQGGPPRASYEPQNFDATMLCFLAAVAAGSNKGSAIRDQLQAVSGPPGKKYTFQQLGQAVKALLQGKQIDYEGVSGPINFDSNGDPSAATYDVYQYQKGKLKVLKQFAASSGG